MSPAEQQLRSEMRALELAGDHSAAVALLLEALLAADDADPACAAARVIYRELMGHREPDHGSNPQHLIVISLPTSECAFLVRIKTINRDTCDYEITHQKKFSRFSDETKAMVLRVLDERVHQIVSGGQ